MMAGHLLHESRLVGGAVHEVLNVAFCFFLFFFFFFSLFTPGSIVH